MSPIPNPKVTFAKRPTDYPIPGEHLIYEPDAETIDLDNVALHGGVLVKTIYISLDPYMRVRMGDPKLPRFTPAFETGKPGDGTALLKVLRSETPRYKAGDYFTGNAQWRAYLVLPEYRAGNVIRNPYNLPLSAFLSVAGPQAMTAFYSTLAHAKWKAGDTIFVSTAAGAVGSVVVQLAKVAGLKVISSTGDDDKVKYLKEELGADVAFNYKKESVWDVLKEHGPIDIYYDNVNGEQLNAALLNASAKGSRFVMCGYASEYNLAEGEEPYNVTNLKLVIGKSISMNGFLLGRLVGQYGIEPWVKEYLPLVKDGKITQREEKTHGLENLPTTMLKMLKGKNQGKVIIVVSED